MELLKPNNYTAFRHFNEIIENQYKPMSEMKNKYTLIGDVICNQREKNFQYILQKQIAEADLFFISGL